MIDEVWIVKEVVFMRCKFIERMDYVLGLSEGQVAGIVIGSIFVAMFVVAGCFCVVR